MQKPCFRILQWDISQLNISRWHIYLKIIALWSISQWNIFCRSRRQNFAIADNFCRYVCRFLRMLLLHINLHHHHHTHHGLMWVKYSQLTACGWFWPTLCLPGIGMQPLGLTTDCSVFSASPFFSPLCLLSFVDYGTQSSRSGIKIWCIQY